MSLTFRAEQNHNGAWLVKFGDFALTCTGGGRLRHDVAVRVACALNLDSDAVALAGKLNAVDWTVPNSGAWPDLWGYEESGESDLCLAAAKLRGALAKGRC